MLRLSRILQAPLGSLLLLFALSLPGTQAEQLDKLTVDGNYFQFVTRPDIKAPTWKINKQIEGEVTPGYWFIAPYETVTQERPGDGWVGPFIYDNNGGLIWSGSTNFGHWNVFDFSVANIDGKQHLSMLDWHEQKGTVLDSSYSCLRTTPMVQGEDTFQNMHAYHVVEDGKRALTLSNHRSFASQDVSMTVGYQGSCNADFQGFREWDHESSTAQPVFQWDARNHVDLDESTYVNWDGTAASYCGGGWDLLHTNAIDKFPDGDYLLSARHTDTLYKISHTDGSIVWRLGGKKSNFTFADGARFSRQHDGRVREQNSTHTIISLFDNAVGADTQAATRRNTRALILSLDLQKMTADIVAEYQHPEEALINGRGSFQILPNGNAFVGWAEYSRISEFAPNGTLLMEALLNFRHDTYRSFKFPWVGRPIEPPDVHSEVTWKDDETFTMVHMSWNGATEVDTWEVRGVAANGTTIELASAKRTGFETSIRYDGIITNVYADALDSEGNVLGTSKGLGQASVTEADLISGGMSRGSGNQLHSILLLIGGVVIGFCGLLAVLFLHRQRWWDLQFLDRPFRGDYQAVEAQEDIPEKSKA